MNEHSQAVWPEKNRQMSILVAQKWYILTPTQKFPNNVIDLGKLIVAKGFKKLPKVQEIAKSGHTAPKLNSYKQYIA